ncbi:MAG TPA: hypothetical protein VNR40_18290, partial [Steroidobacter sp.]|nr:hypothetical protein [Steroidobacter sp.]
MMRSIAVLTGLLLYGCLAMPASAQVLGFNGKWVLNHAKSQGKNSAVEYITYKITDQVQDYIVDETGADGHRFNAVYQARFDGKDYPKKDLVTGKVTYTRVERVFERVELVTNSVKEKGPDGKEGMKVTGWYIRELAPDGM